jgi:hypothetical protein
MAVTWTNCYASFERTYKRMSSALANVACLQGVVSITVLPSVHVSWKVMTGLEARDIKRPSEDDGKWTMGPSRTINTDNRVAASKFDREDGDQIVC